MGSKIEGGRKALPVTREVVNTAFNSSVLPSATSSCSRIAPNGVSLLISTLSSPALCISSFFFVICGTTLNAVDVIEVVSTLRKLLFALALALPSVLSE